ncbi:TetR family transcriptional regulator [Specibacter cremeus]|uniref:TetR family transcriptional regulator n=1 Tax=Specibacter cremeus TaxID=1629051 RepID=UPI000F781F52|nr:TetR family transcriptional regulator [Specibacter cremeus]
MGNAAATRALLRERAMALFLEQGFDETTTAQIAAAAGVSQMTFFRYFPTKESAALDDPYDPLIAGLVAAQDPALPVRERVRRGLLAAWSSLPEPEDNAVRDRIVLVAGHPRLRAGVWENNHRTEELIVEALVQTGAPDLEARVAAGACLGGLTAALFDWAAGPDGHSLGERLRTALALMAPADGGGGARQ